jgi:two-component system chemotaxis response regulator CheB
MGHAFSAASLLAEQSEELEQALWAVLNLIEERQTLSHQLAMQARAHDQNELSSDYEKKAQSAQQHAALVKRILLEDGEWYSTADL